MDIIWIILIFYLIFIFALAWYFSRKESLETYFLNKRRTSLWLLTFSTAATVIGAGAVVALVSEVYNSGISYGIVLPVSGIVGMLVLGFMASKIKSLGDKYNSHTIVDFFYNRFDMKNKILTGILQLFLLIIWISVQAIAIATLASVLIGVEYHIALFFAAAITIFYTSVGGLKIDIITDFVQFWIMIFVFFIMSIIAYNHVGGFGALLSNLPAEHLNPFGFGGISWFIGGILLSGFIYLGNTTHWQRIFSAKNQETAKKSFFLSIPFITIIALFALFLGLVASVTLSDINQDMAIFSLMNLILPKWIIGLGFAAILAVVMSSIDSLLIGGSTIIHKALFKRDGKKQLIYARLITALFGIFGFLIAFMIPNIVGLSLLVAYIALIFVPAIFGGILSKKVSANASFYSILIPFLILILSLPFLGSNSFIVPTLTSILIIVFYDKIFKKKTPTPLEIIGFEE